MRSAYRYWMVSWEEGQERFSMESSAADYRDRLMEQGFQAVLQWVDATVQPAAVVPVQSPPAAVPPAAASATQADPVEVAVVTNQAMALAPVLSIVDGHRLAPIGRVPHQRVRRPGASMCGMHIMGGAVPIFARQRIDATMAQ